VVFRLGGMLPTMSAHLAVERLEARGLVGTARSSPQPPLAVARRARLEVVGPTRQHRTKRWMRILSARWGIMRRPLRTAGSTVVFAVHYRFGRNIASGVRRRHVPNAVRRYAAAEGMTRSPAPVPAGTAVRGGQRRIWFFRMLIILPQLVRTGTPSCGTTWRGAPRQACARQRRATFVPQSAPTKRGPKWKVGRAAWSAGA
jgi:hypothetical protein